MERLKKINQHYNGSFRLLDYNISHGLILLRCSIIVNEAYVNLDLKFEGVDYIELPSNFKDMYITNGNEDDWDYIKSRYNSDIYNVSPSDFQQLFKIITEGKVYYILAASCLIDSNTLNPEQSSVR